MATCAACAAGAAGLAPLGIQTAQAGSGGEKPRVRLVFSHTPSTGPIWPNIGYDFEPRKKEIAQKLAALCPDVEVPAGHGHECWRGAEAPERRQGQEDRRLRRVASKPVGRACRARSWPRASRRFSSMTSTAARANGSSRNAAARRAGLKTAGISTSRIRGRGRRREVLRDPEKARRIDRRLPGRGQRLAEEEHQAGRRHGLHG